MQKLKFKGYIKDTDYIFPVRTFSQTTVQVYGQLDKNIKGKIKEVEDSDGNKITIFRREAIELLQYININDKDQNELYDRDIVDINGQIYMIAYYYNRWLLIKSNGGRREFKITENDQIKRIANTLSESSLLTPQQLEYKL